MVAMQFAETLLPNTRLRVGYNSLGAGASVNHLHFQVWHTEFTLPMESSDTFVEDMTARVRSRARDRHGAKVEQDASPTPASFHVGVSLGAPVPFMVWTYTHSQVVGAAASIQRALDTLVELNQPHNVVLTRGHTYVLPRHRVVLLHDTINPGFPEATGHFICSDELYDNITVEDISAHMEKHIALRQLEFERVCAACLFDA
eukprot:m.899173 g.899173  ORF g.899173 m.899173 type:complete len:202 (+) comp23679_c0_seq3:166-771(+)